MNIKDTGTNHYDGTTAERFQETLNFFSVIVKPRYLEPV